MVGPPPQPADAAAARVGSATLFARAYRRALVVSNPVSGRGQGGKAARELEAGLRRRGIAAELFETGKRGDAFTRLRCLDQSVDLVCSVGGDGTLREVLEGLVDPEIPVAVLPFGTANVLAGALGLPRDVHHALDIIERKHLSSIDVAHVNGKLSFLVTGVGFDGMAVRDVEEHRNGPITKWRYVEAVARTLRKYKPPRLSVELDGRPLPDEYGFVLVSNTIGYGGILHLASDTRIDDGVFEVYLFPTGRVLEILSFAVRGMMRRLPGGAAELRRARSVRVRSEEPVPYQIDGDLGGETPVEIEIAPNQYRLVVP